MICFLPKVDTIGASILICHAICILLYTLNFLLRLKCTNVSTASVPGKRSITAKLSTSNPPFISLEHRVVKSRSNARRPHDTYITWVNVPFMAMSHTVDDKPSLGGSTRSISKLLYPSSSVALPLRLEDVCSLYCLRRGLAAHSEASPLKTCTNVPISSVN